MSLSKDIAANIGTPQVALNDVRISSGVLPQIREVLNGISEARSVALLMDERQYSTPDGHDVKQTVIEIVSSSHRVRQVVLSGEVHADEVTVAAATRDCAEADVVLTVGSGTLSDIGKVAAGKRPHIIVQTAASVNGFADDQSVLLQNGAKRTVHSAWPHSLLVDQDVLRGAPVSLNASGLGDMISMFTAPADWYLSSLFQMDRGFEYGVATTTRRYGEDLLGISEGVGKSDSEALTTLAEFVTLSGISMGLAGQTSPSSGMEHTVSHLIDMANGAKHRPNALHGQQVGVATIMVAILWRRVATRIANKDIPPLRLPSWDEAKEAVYGAFSWMDPEGVTAAECWADYSKKLHHLEEINAPARLDAIIASWAEHQKVIDTLLAPPERIADALRQAKGPVRFSTLGEPVDADTAVWALTHCQLMRNRFTIADLAWLTGIWTSEDVQEAIAEAEKLDAGL